MLLTERMVSVRSPGVSEVLCALLISLPSRSRTAAGPLRCLVAGLGAGRPWLVLGDVILGGRLQQRAHLFLHRHDPFGDLHPLGSVPLLHVGRLMPVVIAAGYAGHRTAELRQSHFLPALFGDAEGLQSAPDIFAADRLLAGDL